MLKQLLLRPNSGDKGQWTGGNGVVREVEFTVPSHASVLSQRRVYSPCGMAGGEDEARGVNYLGRKMDDASLRWINLDGSRKVDLQAGDRVKSCTPGGGGYGKPGAEQEGLGVRTATQSMFHGLTVACGSMSRASRRRIRVHVHE